jgi:hypothetical protein
MSLEISYVQKRANTWAAAEFGVSSECDIADHQVLFMGKLNILLLGILKKIS